MRQFGLIHRDQALSLGLTSSSLGRMVESGVLALVHRSSLQPVEKRRVGPFVVTDIVRTLLDMGSVTDEESVEVALDSGIRRGLVTVPYIQKRLERITTRGRPGARSLARIVEQRGDVPAAESPLETRVARLFRRCKLQIRFGST
jgi:hypothetical protein